MIGSPPAATLEAAAHVELDSVELWVGDLAQTVGVLTSKCGFACDETAVEARSAGQAVALRWGEVSFVIRQGASVTDPIARHVAIHGDGVGDVALVCDEIGSIVARALDTGLKTSFQDGCARVDLLGDGTILHSLRKRRFVPRSVPYRRRDGSQMRGVDHVTYCLPWGTLDGVARIYREVFGLDEVHNEDCVEIGDSATGMRSMVLRSQQGFTVVLTEPISSSSNGQTLHFVRAHAGPGVQHVALACDDLIEAVGVLRSKGTDFLHVPEEHLQRSHQRLRDRALPWNALCQHEILVDADQEGVLFQIFTRPILQRSFFLELIHRAGATGFGGTNVRALFAALQAATRDCPEEAAR